MTLSMVSTAIQAVIGEELLGSTDHTPATQLLVAVLRILLLLATFMIANRTFTSKKHHKPSSPYNGATHSLLVQSRVMKASPKKKGGFKGKQQFHLPSEDEDALSTSVGSSDSELDTTSSEHEEDVKGTRISISELLRRRPAAGDAPHGSLKTTHVGSSLQQRCSWDKVRGAPSTQHQPGLGKATSKAATSKVAKISPKAPCKKPPVPVKSMPASDGDALETGAKQERIQALLSIICPEEVAA